MTITSPPPAARLRPQDLGGLASAGLRTRKLRAALSALGISIGVAAIVAVLGLASSSQAGLLAEISKLGTNLLTATNGQNLSGGAAELPKTAPGMVAELPGVTGVQYTGTLSNVNAYRSPYIPAIDTNALSRIRPGMRIWVGGQWFYVTGVLNPAALTPEIDSAILVGFPAARKYLAFDGHPSEIYLRTVSTQAATTRADNLLGAQANPENPSDVDVAQPSDALTAQADTAGAFNDLFLGLGAVALLVGAVGVANIMVISVLERRQEIGLRRTLGATRGQIRIQFLADAILLSLAAGVVGVAAGAAATALYARAHGEAIVIPPDAWAGGLAAALLIGVAAGLLPAIRAARLSPTQALWSL